MSKRQQANDDSLRRVLFHFDERLAQGTSDHADQETSLESAGDTQPNVDRDVVANLQTLRLLDAVREVDQSSERHKIGRFEIIRELGRGGYGVVLLAHDPRLKRNVALKVPRPEAIVTEDLRQRFFREAEAAAALNHPNILPIYENGSSGPVCYIAMAYCDGPSLLEWVQQHGPLNPKVAAQIVATLADALQHAHNRGVLHRDVKPANVLLETNSREPEKGDLEASARLTDFGLARMDSSLGQTQTGDILGTPLYMSPEQAAGHSDAIGPATDIYALGATLYFLLTGKPPLKGDTDVQTLVAIQNDDPAAPSRHVAAIPQDLDAVCLKCLEKPPSNRYLTATELQADLERFLNDEPVRARKITPFVQVARWTRRNPLLAAAAGLVATMAIASFAWINYERSVAEKNAKNTRDTLLLLTKTFGKIDPNEGGTAEMTAKDVLLNAWEAIQSSEVDAEHKQTLLDNLCRCFFNIGEYELARTLASQNVAIAQQLEDLESELNSRSNHAAALAETGRAEEAIPLLQQIAEEWKELGPCKDSLSTRTSLASAYLITGKIDDSIREFETVQVEFQKLGLSDEADALNSMTLLSAALIRKGRYEEANDTSQQVSLKLKEKLGENHPETLRAELMYGMNLRNLNQPAECVEVLSDVLRRQKPTLGNEHPQALTTRRCIAFATHQLGRLDEAKAAYLSLLESYARVMGESHRDTYPIRSSLAHIHFQTGQMDEAISILRDVYEACQQSLGSSHFRTLEMQLNLGVKLIETGLHEEGAAHLNSALAHCKSTLGDEHPKTLKAMSCLAVYHYRDREPETALKMLQEVLDTQVSLGMQRQSRLVTVTNIAKVLEVLDPDEEALQEFRQVANEYLTSTEVNQEQIAHFHFDFGSLLCKMEQFAEADSALRDCLSYYESNNPESWRSIEAQSVLGEVALGQGKFDIATTMLTQAHKGIKQQLATIPPRRRNRILRESIGRIQELAQLTDNQKLASKCKSELEKLSE